MAHCDSETATATGYRLSPKVRKMFPVLYVIIFAFYPGLNLDCPIIERSFFIIYKNLLT